MSDQPFDVVRLNHLLGKMRDGSITDEQVAELDAILRENPDAQSYYVDYVLLCGQMRKYRAAPKMVEAEPEPLPTTESLLEEVMIQQQAAAARREAEAALAKQQQELRDAERRESMRRLYGLSKPPEGPQTKHYVIPRPLFYGSIAAVIAIIAVIIWPMMESPDLPKLDDEETNAPDPQLVATLAEAVDAKWADGETVLVGDALLPGELELKDGYVRFNYASGASVIVEAPAQFALETNDRMRLMSGKVVGQCPTPESRGFTIVAPGSRIVDRGTEFGVDVAETGLTDVHVFDGLVEMQIGDETAAEPSGTIKLSGGEALRMSDDGQSTSRMKADELDFIRALTADELDPFKRYARRVMRSNPRAYWRFESMTGNRIRNEVEGGPEIELVGPVYVQKDPDERYGVFPRNNREQYFQALDPIKDFGGAYYSIEIWIRPRIDHGGTFITLVDWPQKRFAIGAIELSETVSGGVRFADALSGDPEDNVSAIATRAYVPGQWHHIVAVHQGEELLLYINGRVAARKTRSGSTRAHVLPLLGMVNFDVNARRYIGDVDELALYERALTPQEIEKHYGELYMRHKE